jgi:hypothetical protein
MLRTLERLSAHVAANGVDADAREAIARVHRYFEPAGPDHHADEEVDLSQPAGAAEDAAGDSGTRTAIDRLEAGHHEMERAWAGLYAHLAALRERWAMSRRR